MPDMGFDLSALEAFLSGQNLFAGTEIGSDFSIGAAAMELPSHSPHTSYQVSQVPGPASWPSGAVTGHDVGNAPVIPSHDQEELEEAGPDSDADAE